MVYATLMKFALRGSASGAVGPGAGHEERGTGSLRSPFLSRGPGGARRPGSQWPQKPTTSEMPTVLSVFFRLLPVTGSVLGSELYSVR